MRVLVGGRHLCVSLQAEVVSTLSSGVCLITPEGRGLHGDRGTGAASILRHRTLQANVKYPSR